MKLLKVLFFLLILSPNAYASSAINSEAEVYLLTILPGNEIYSLYGHSALRVVIPGTNYDRVFNWGVFDFSTPNFGYKFVRGRLNYMLAVYPYDRFLQEYFLEQRTVISQKVFLTSGEKEKLIKLAQENAKPENIFYLYDFFYDNCATRIRDIIEEALNGEVNLSITKRKATPTFRELLDHYQKPYRWLDLGIDLLLGMSADRKASPSNQMFLPDFLMSNLSDATVTRGPESSVLLGEPQIVYDFDKIPVSSSRFTSPMFVLWTLLIFILLISLSNIKMRWIRRIDLVIFSFYSLLSVILIITNLFTDHGALKWNLNIIWLSPLIIGTLINLVISSRKVHWYRLNLVVTVLFLALAPLIPQSVNRFFVPLILILIIRLFFLSSFGKAIR